MTIAELLADCFGRIREVTHEVVDGLSPEQLMAQPDAEANTIAWLVWHLTRVQDDHIAGAFGREQVWISDGWCDRFGLPFAPSAHGYGHSTEEMLDVRVDSGDLLTGYHDAVHDRTVECLRDISTDDLERIVDPSFDPPVSLGVRLVSVIADDLQHAGQAAYVRGLVERGLDTE